MKIKHNKLRNTYLIYEMLVRQITTDTLNNKDSHALNILRKYFNNTEILKEYKIYSTILSTKGLSETKANILIESAIAGFKKINKNKKNKEKYEIISEIKKSYDINEFFKSKIDNYKTIASLYLLLEMDDSEYVNPEVVSKYKFTILESVCASKEKEEQDEILESFSKMDKGSRSLVYKLMINNFNQKYSGLDGRQKSLLREYINNIATPDTFRKYINEEIQAVKNQLNIHINKIQDPARKIKLEELYSILTPLNENRKINEETVHNILSYYELLKELENVTNKS